MEEQERKPVASLREYLDNAREAGSIFRWIWREVTTPQSRRKLYRMFGGLVVVIILQTIQPGAVAYIFNGLTSRNGKMIYGGLGVFFACLVIQKLADRYQESAREWVLGLHWGRLDDRITELFFEKSVGQHIHEGTTLAVSNIDKGRWRLLDMQGMLLFEGIPSITQLIVAYVFLCFLNWFAGLVMGLVILTYLCWSMYLNFRVNQVCTPIDKEFRALNRRRVERWERVERVKISGKEQEETREMSGIFDEVIARDRHFWLWFIKQAHIRGLVNAGGLVTIMAWGAWLVWSGKWQIGLLYPLYAWTSRVSENIWRIGAIEHHINWNLPSVKSMITALRIPPAITDSSEAVVLDHTVPHRIEFAQVSHTYPADMKKTAEAPAALIRVNFTVEPGEKVALLGASGAGKTTVMRKLLRFDDPTSGGVLVDGIDLRTIHQASWRRGIGYIPQQAQVFDGTIRYNLTYRLGAGERARITDAELWNLMQLLQIDFKDRLTHGLDTVVGKNGIKLSGGQAQRLMIGAAVIRRPWLLVVDEATSSLDSVTEHEVQAGLATVLSGSATSALIVAHRLSTVRHLCTKFVVLKAANEVREGESQVEAIANSFEDLYRESPTFRRLADYQGVGVQTPLSCHAAGVETEPSTV
ncbi:MAG TPA: ABC transporter ATP-binding protein [Verrucomicrobiae bacterium]|nr:ABC transporter ATP-binding protein [Verrucomicrobiae bacterium]